MTLFVLTLSVSHGLLKCLVKMSESDRNHETFVRVFRYFKVTQSSFLLTTLTLFIWRIDGLILDRSKRLLHRLSGKDGNLELCQFQLDRSFLGNDKQRTLKSGFLKYPKISMSSRQATMCMINYILRQSS